MHRVELLRPVNGRGAGVCDLVDMLVSDTCGYFVNWIWIAVMCYNMFIVIHSTWKNLVGGNAKYVASFLVLVVTLSEYGVTFCSSLLDHMVSRLLLAHIEVAVADMEKSCLIMETYFILYKNLAYKYGSYELIHSNEISNAFGSVTTNNAVSLESTPPENRVAGSALDEGKLAQLCRIMEANKPTLLCHSEGADTNASPGHFRQEEVIHPIGKAGTGFSNESQLSVGISSLNSNIVPLFEKVLSASDAGRIGRLVLPKACAEEAQTTALPSGTASAETSFSADGDIGWNKGESQGGKINGDARHQPTAEKKRNRNIGPKSKRLLMHREDALELRLTWEEAQDLLRPPPSVKPSIVTIEDHEFEEFDEPPVFGKRTIFAHQSSGGQEQWAQCDDCSKWRKLPEHVLLPPKWTCSDNIWDSSRCLCSAPEEISPKDLDNLLRLSKDFKKRRIVGRHKPSPECEPSGLDALASAAVLGDNIGDTGEPSVGATTKHPRHRSGCTCIVCIQPPSGKGKHNPTCTCNVCMTVKRRFKTLMLRKKKRQSEEHEAEISQKDNNDHKDESEMISKLSNAVLPVSNSGNEVSQNREQTEVAETSAGSLDLNCHPNRDEMQLDMPGLSMRNIVDPFDSYTKQNGLPNLMCDRHSSFGPCLHSQTNGEYPRTLSDEAFHDSMGWNRESRGD
ncbi:hypothetical protein GH714_012408 [Hevea brasiliensis]|uniref:CW-type domain-containing protein n=1 Tax=Hevea brasiliensis TaxID=3981 RepID=A0A6A6LBD2_HEVBR|nr:hypothetical protein GH714_012408 [Hevea brasiliensis]